MVVGVSDVALSQLGRRRGQGVQQRHGHSHQQEHQDHKDQQQFEELRRVWELLLWCWRLHHFESGQGLAQTIGDGVRAKHIDHGHAVGLCTAEGDGHLQSSLYFGVTCRELAEAAFFQFAYLRHIEPAQTCNASVVELAQDAQSKHGLGVDEVWVHKVQGGLRSIEGVFYTPAGV